MDRDLETLLLRDNPWILDPERLPDWLRLRLPEIVIPRIGTEARRKRWDETDRSHLVIGPRQAGKSTLVWAHLADRGEPVLYVDCEQPLIREWCRSAPLFLADLEPFLTSFVPLFFDEVQHLEEAGLFFKGLVDRKIGVPVLVTGSSSYHLGARTRESLAGRATRMRLLPFSLAEVCQDLADRSPGVRERLTRERFERHVVVGGYPEVWLSETPEVLLADLVQAIVLRDASDLHRISRPDAFRRLLQLLPGQVGQLVNLSEWASILGINRDTVASYVEILEAAHIVFRLPPFAGGKRAEVTSRAKIYLVDNGIRNQLVGDFRALEERATDVGPLLESWVFTELRKVLPEEATLHFWRSASGAEVDFVVARGGDVVGIEVKAGALRRPTLPRAARSFLEAYRPRAFFLVNAGFEGEDEIQGSKIEWIRPRKLAQQVVWALS